ncbi:MAG: hypothetical protein KAJ19_23630 [Gammaproteobacteria bacterium]|nr:hypothetical protein [Gammaproteobacteria bacterium]
MLDPTENPRIPLADIEEILVAKRLTRSLYLRVRARWFEWLEQTGQPHKPIMLSPGEESALDFIDYQLSAEEKASCVAWRESLGIAYLDCPNDVVHEGYRITFTFDDKNECVVVTLIGRAKTCPNFGKAMTSRHVDIDQALMMALYKQIVVFNNETWGSTDAEAMFG